MTRCLNVHLGLTSTRRDEAQLGKLQQLGMTSSDEIKLMAMREYISKLANATARFVLFLIY